MLPDFLESNFNVCANKLFFNIFLTTECTCCVIFSVNNFNVFAKSVFNIFFLHRGALAVLPEPPQIRSLLSIEVRNEMGDFEPIPF